LIMFDRHKRSARRIGEILRNFADIVTALGHPQQVALFERIETPTAADVFQAAVERMEENYAPRVGTAVTSTLFQDPPEGRGLVEDSPRPTESEADVSRTESTGETILPGETGSETTVVDTSEPQTTTQADVDPRPTAELIVPETSIQPTAELIAPESGQEPTAELIAPNERSQEAPVGDVPTPPPRTREDVIATFVQDKLARGEPFPANELFASAEDAYGGTLAEGAYTPKDAYDAMELGINRLLSDQSRGIADPTVELDQALENLQALQEKVL